MENEQQALIAAIEEIKGLLVKAEQISTSIELLPLSAILCTILGVIYRGDIPSLMKLSEIVHEYTLVFKKELENEMGINSEMILS